VQVADHVCARAYHDARGAGVDAVVGGVI